MVYHGVMEWFGWERALKPIPCHPTHPLPCPGRDTFHYPRLLQVLSIPAWNTPREPCFPLPVWCSGFTRLFYTGNSEAVPLSSLVPQFWRGLWGWLWSKLRRAENSSRWNWPCFHSLFFLQPMAEHLFHLLSCPYHVGAESVLDFL